MTKKGDLRRESVSGSRFPANCGEDPPHEESDLFRKYVVGGLDDVEKARMPDLAEQSVSSNPEEHKASNEPGLQLEELARWPQRQP